MNTTQKQLLALLTSAIHGTVPSHELFSSVKGKELLDLAIQQDVSSFLYPTLNNYSTEIKLDVQTRERWKTTSLFMAVRQASLTTEIKAIIDLLRTNNIPAISIKGLVLKQLYPQPELRNMGDVDLLITEENMQKSIALLSTVGYTPNPENLKRVKKQKHTEMIKPGSFAIELHRTLWRPLIMKKRDNQIWFKHIWENKRPLEVEGIQLTALSPEDELIHLIVHLATHFISSGVMFRQLCDFILFLEAYWQTIDQEYIIQILRSMELITFFQYLLLTCHLFLGLTITLTDNIPEKYIPEMLLADIFNYPSNTESADEYECWKVLNRHYPFARKNLTLIPLAFLLEAGIQFTINKKDLFQSITFTKKSFEGFRTRVHFLRSIGLLAR